MQHEELLYALAVPGNDRADRPQELLTLVRVVQRLEHSVEGLVATLRQSVLETSSRIHLPT